jgi:hypothetical protein
MSSFEPRERDLATGSFSQRAERAQQAMTASSGAETLQPATADRPE